MGGGAAAYPHAQGALPVVNPPLPPWEPTPASPVFAPAAAPAFTPSPPAVASPAGPSPRDVVCPSCGARTQVAAGLHGICFSCGQPIPPALVAQASGAAPQPVVPVAPAPHRVSTAGIPGAPPPRFPLTAAIAEEDLAPPANPYAAALGVRLVGGRGSYLVGEVELRVGRDPAHCAIVLAEPRVSGVHATLKFERTQLFVRDDGSNNGTYVDGARIAPHEWVPVRPGATLRFGPEEFSVRQE